MNPCRASARRVTMASRCSPTTTVTGARKCPASERAASTSAHSASRAGAPYGVTRTATVTPATVGTPCDTLAAERQLPSGR